MTTTEQNEIIEGFEDYAAHRAWLGCRFDKAENASPEQPYADFYTNDLFALYRAGYAQARCCYGMVAPL